MNTVRFILNALFSRAMLAALACLVLALLLWFVGPLIAIDGLRPLASAGARVWLIVLVLLLAICWLAAAPMSLVGVAALCVLAWYGGPLLSLGNTRPLAPLWARLAAVGTLLALCAGWWLWQLWRMLRGNPQAIAEFFATRSDDEKKRQAARDRLHGVDRAVRQALAALRQLRGTGGWRRLFDRQRHVYALPWYLVVGAAGSGKTTALLNAGLQFPGSVHSSGATSATALHAQQGTEHCDWWLGNDAVLIDTAGRLTTQGRPGAAAAAAPAPDGPQGTSGTPGTSGAPGTGSTPSTPSTPGTPGMAGTPGAADAAEASEAAEAANAAAQWQGLLALLRRHRPRAPINGAILALSTVELIQRNAAERAVHAERLRERLRELRQTLGVRFPVYVLVTKADVLPGFPEYFHTLGSEGRAQAWGFTRPEEAARGRRRAAAGDASALGDWLRDEFTLLRERIEQGLRGRLNEEHDLHRRQRMLALPQELRALGAPLVGTLEHIFLDSRYDETQQQPMLRGVYLTSGAQSSQAVPADTGAVMRRLTTAQEGEARATSDSRRGRLGFFLQDVLARVVIPEAHLVGPNLPWERRMRALRWLGHGLALVLAGWLCFALMVSHGNNQRYLDAVAERTHALNGQARAAFAAGHPQALPELLDRARALPEHSGLDPAHPPPSFLYGLYSVPPVHEAARSTYARWQDQALLPAVLRRMEAALARSVQDGDEAQVYRTLRAYRLVHDPQRYMQGGAEDVRAWALGDWEQDSGGAAASGLHAALLAHVRALFSGERALHPASSPDEALMRRARELLDRQGATERVYERTRTALAPQAPPPFTLLRAVGPQAGAVFARAGGQALSQGVPGLFTHEGYHALVSPRLADAVARALKEDRWVMGSAHGAQDGDDADALEDVRRRYLAEYARHWQAFLDEVRVVGADETQAAGLGFDLNLLRQFAAPDSPLSRLARAASRETTLSKAPDARAGPAAGLLDKAAEALRRPADALQTLQAPPAPQAASSERARPTAQALAKELVDDRFAALREVVTGSSDGGPAGAPPDPAAGLPAGAAPRPALDSVSALVNEFYTQLTVADAALATGGLPPGAGELGTRLRLEANRLPAPFREVLGALAGSGIEKVGLGTEAVLRKLAQAQFDRLVGLMASQVGEPCRRGLEGRYPIEPVADDIAIDDFTLMFAGGGAMEDFFNQHLAPFVDTGTRPWRYRTPETLGAAPSGTGATVGTAVPGGPPGPTVQGELLKLLAREGPSLDSFYRARQIRQLFFPDAGGRKFGWRLDLRVMDLEPGITELGLDIDGQGLRYVHGPVQSFPVHWPGPRGGTTAQFTASPRISAATSTLGAQGPWALLRLIDKGRLVPSAHPGRVGLEFQFDGRRALLDLSAGGQPSPLNSDLLRGFRCPGRHA